MDVREEGLYSRGLVSSWTWQASNFDVKYFNFYTHTTLPHKNLKINLINFLNTWKKFKTCVCHEVIVDLTLTFFL